ncbi:hypothetical protein HNP38_000488 [Chryseobacterium defluvii]|uniref:Lipoprotein n=1 Tax=Chryseobacterium defluvii TaxID=160396 RepID=A0A840K7N4_9FLAO|nr:hypothetical protein [Chryseobacterium defluvii]MBB4805216.1 hypothetical protein [Chryseobacterium defluvii]
MIKSVKSLIILASFTLFSCDHIIDEIDREREEESYTTPYMGKWTGNFNGDQSGTLVLNVGKSGTIEGVRVSGSFQETFYTSLLGGGSGAINGITTSGSGFVLHGSLESKSGTWTIGNLNGTWSVIKN